jgi:competence protein ComEA
LFGRILIVAAITVITAHAEDPEGKKLLQRVCGQCHKFEIVTSRRLTKDGWEKTVQAMVDKGADATDEEFNAVIDYLAKNYGPASGSAKLNVNKATAAELSAFLEIPQSDAAAIVRYRETNGNFKSWEHLKKVPGTDSKKLEAKKDRLEF